MTQPELYERFRKPPGTSSSTFNLKRIDRPGARFEGLTPDPPLPPDYGERQWRDGVAAGRSGRPCRQLRPARGLRPLSSIDSI